MPVRRTGLGIVCVVAALVVGAPAHGEGKPRVAVLDFLDKAGVEGGTSALVADVVRSELYRTGEVDLVEREQLDKVMAEQKPQVRGIRTQNAI